jgi:hypothetical protein
MTFLAISVEPGKEAEKKTLFWQGTVFPNCQKITSQMPGTECLCSFSFSVRRKFLVPDVFYNYLHVC